MASMQENRNSVDIKAPHEALQNQQAFNAKRGQTSPKGNEFSQLMAFDGNTTGTASYLESGLDGMRGATRS